jgi:hypothetical protein
LGRPAPRTAQAPLAPPAHHGLMVLMLAILANGSILQYFAGLRFRGWLLRRFFSRLLRRYLGRVWGGFLGRVRRRFFRRRRRRLLSRHWGRLWCSRWDGSRSRRCRRNRYPVLGRVAVRALSAIVSDRSCVAGVTQGITGVVEGHLGPVVDRMAVRALPRPVSNRCGMARQAIRAFDMLVGDYLPVHRVVAIAAGVGVVLDRRRRMAGDTVRQTGV